MELFPRHDLRGDESGKATSREQSSIRQLPRGTHWIWGRTSYCSTANKRHDRHRAARKCHRGVQRESALTTQRPLSPANTLRVRCAFVNLEQCNPSGQPWNRGREAPRTPPRTLPRQRSETAEGLPPPLPCDQHALALSSPRISSGGEITRRAPSPGVEWGRCQNPCCGHRRSSWTCSL